MEIPMVIILSVVLVCVPVSGRDEYTTDHWFFRSDEGLTEVPDDIPNTAVGIYIDTNGITSLRAGDFSGLPSVTFLSLSWNPITDIEPGSFVGLTGIKDLTIFRNSLTRLKSGMFTGLDSLDNLVLSNNQIDTIDDGAFTGLHNLEKIYLYGNALTHLRAGMFIGLDSLDELTLSFNQITTMDVAAFEGLGNVKELWLDNNVIKELVHNQFIGLKSMKLLHMTINNISTVEDGTFKGQDQLKKIWIDSNKIEEPRKEMWDGLTSIELLNMDGNFISVIKGGVFNHLTHIKELDFENNTVTEVKLDAFRGLSNLTTVWLNENELTTIAASVFYPLPRPLTLSLNDNPMQCDSRLCWLKRGEREGWVRWNEARDDGKVLNPDCEGGVYWDSLNISCPEEVNCPDPGGINHAARSESHWPFNIDSKITYTCNPCYTGGGTITCQSDGTWSEKPSCSVIQCSDPGDIENGRKVPDTATYTCGRQVTYMCNHGYHVEGEASLLCQNNNQFNGSAPACRPGADPRTAASTSGEQKSDDSLRWILIAVGVGVLIIIIIVCVIVILKRRGFHMCYREPRGAPSGGVVESVGGAGAVGISNMDAEGGFVNKAAMLDEEEDEERYTRLRSKSEGGESNMSAASGGACSTGTPTPNEPPPEYTRHPSQTSEIGENQL